MKQIKSRKDIEKKPVRITKNISLPKFIVSKLERSLIETPPSFNLNKSLALFFLHLIAIRRYTDPDCDESFEGFVSLDSFLLEHCSYQYRKYFNYFLSNDILEKRNYSTDRHRANSFRFIYDSNEDCIEFVEVELTSLQKLKNFEVIEQFNGKIERCPHLVKWFYEGLEIEYENAISEALKEEDFLKRQSYLLGIEKLKNKEYWFTRNSKSDNRLHTPLTNLAKKIRPNLRFRGQKLANFDVRCSQPYFLVVLIEEMYSSIDTLMFENLIDILYSKGFREEYGKIKDWILKDDFYTKMANELFDGMAISLERIEWFGKGKKKEMKRVIYENERELVKKLILRLFYIDTNSNSYKKGEDFTLFDSKFPNFSAFLKEFKKNDYKELSKLMQNKEAHCILDVVTQRLTQMYPKMPLFTIHDSIMTTERWAEKTNLGKLIQTIMQKENGVKPQINA
ncbi:hypothetical protein [uncultured Chryseobacterium sp.]|uniref:hypothetical protein n=1 Tax=uncultured Chryseobacterium sp. TaxID=259322 RepID=UPI00258E050F|nr:hypothetical protein [uncultured Chryseobacterium sp.]